MMLSTVIAGSLAAVVAMSAGHEDITDRGRLQGTWRPVTAELGGQPFPEEVRKSITLVVSGDEYLVTVGAQPDRGTVFLTTTSFPKAMDIAGVEGPNKGRTLHAIYDVDGDTLRVCYDLSGAGRPAAFTSAAGTQLFLVVYNRVRQ
jgi:uncharacterized protein (TIGR03067 family)